MSVEQKRASRETVERADESDEPVAGTGMLIAVAFVVTMTFWTSTANASGPRVVPLVVLGTAYLLLSTLGWAWCERRGRRAHMMALLGILTLLAVAALWINRFSNPLIVFPLICMFVLYVGTPWAITLTVVLAAFESLLATRAGARPLQVVLSGLDLVPGAAFTIVFAQLVQRERRARQELRRYASQAEELAVIDERSRIAREIHDSVGHYLTIIHVQIEAARAIIASNGEAAQECLVRAQALAHEGLTELRRSVSVLRTGPPVERRPFGIALSSLLEDCRNSGLDASLTVEGVPRALAPDIEFTLYRAAQEALTNVARHSHAPHVTCALRYDEREVSLRVDDDGVGATSTAGGFGLTGLQERVGAVGGTVNVRTAAGAGFTLAVRVPI
jgi:signal transduction histidine kinase